MYMYLRLLCKQEYFCAVSVVAKNHPVGSDCCVIVVCTAGCFPIVYERCLKDYVCFVFYTPLPDVSWRHANFRHVSSVGVT